MGARRFILNTGLVGAGFEGTELRHIVCEACWHCAPSLGLLTGRCAVQLPVCAAQGRAQRAWNICAVVAACETLA